MKLSNSDKNILRREIEELLENSLEPLVKIDKDLTEMLMFDEAKTLLTDIPVKFIVWSGPFLRRLDLSDVSFDNVAWHGNSSLFWDEMESLIRLPKERYTCLFTDLSGTNASIDFSKSFEYVYSTKAFHLMPLRISNCNLEGVTLLNSHLIDSLDGSILTDAKNTRNTALNVSRILSENLSKEVSEAKVLKELENIPFGERVSIDKDLLSNFIFTECKTPFTEVPIKLIDISGEILRKFDLSEISFDFVAWSSSSPSFWSKLGNIIDIDKGRYIGMDIDLSGTNASIDFGASFEEVYRLEGLNGYIKLAPLNCNFENVDLSNSNASVIDCAYNCNFAFTNSDFFINTTFRDCNLENVDLSHISIESSMLNPNLDGEFSGCNLRGTGIKIYHDFYSYQEMQYEATHLLNKLHENEALLDYTMDMIEIMENDLEYDLDNEELSDSYDYSDLLSNDIILLKEDLAPYLEFENTGRILGKLIKSGMLDGCFVNDTRIDFAFEREKTSENVLRKYENYRKKVMRKARGYLNFKTKTSKNC